MEFKIKQLKIKQFRHLGITMISIGVLVFVSFTKSLAIPRESKADVEALMAFKNVLDDPYDCLSDWDSTTSACEWRGLNCSLVQHLWRVSQINLRGCELHGHISPYLGNLSHLVSLDLPGNFFFGSIPESFSKLFRLRNLNLASNLLTGTLPYLGNLSHLVSLDLSRNGFNGSIPESFISKLFRLRNLNLASNLLTGTLPTFMSHNSSLKTMFINDNNFSGLLPTSIFMLHGLEVVDFSHNYFTGFKPFTLTTNTNISSVKSLKLSSNNLSCTLPTWISQFTNLENIDVSYNNFTGRLVLPVSNLESINVSHNSFSGSFPISISFMYNLTYIDVSHNNFTGRLVLPVSNVSKMVTMDVSHNSFSGSFPISISFMYNLTYMDFSHNNFSGSIPEWIFELQNLIKMRLSYNAFSGPIPNAISISSLSSLEQVDFSHNKLTGPLPDWLPLLNGVLLWDFSYNDFHGRLPCSHYRGSISFTGNAKLCGTCLEMPPCKTGEHSTTEHKQEHPNKHNHKHRHHELLLLFLLILVGMFGMICFVLVIYVFLTRASSKRKSIYGYIGFGNHRLKILSQEDLKAATGGFSLRNFLGEGSYATVYRRVLQDGEIVAVKLFQDFHKKRARKSFLAECHTLGKVRHKNLVRIITACSACSSEDFNALVLEFMPNGSLDRLLHSRAQYMRFSAIDLKMRLRFLTEIAGALSYLHHDCTPTIIHCDVKPQNVLLDGDVCARLSDFGIARLVNDSSGGVTTTLMLKGSIGYIAPEYGVGASVCTRGDVYSFGVTVLEVMTRIKPTDAIIGSSEMGFPRWVSMAMGSKEEMVETLLSKEGQEAIHKEDDDEVEKFARLVNLGLICTSLAPEKRPTMRQVHIMLREFSHELKDWGNYTLDEILELHLLHRQTTSV